MSTWLLCSFIETFDYSFIYSGGLPYLVYAMLKLQPWAKIVEQTPWGKAILFVACDG